MLAGFVLPYLIDYDNILQVVEMSIVAPPCVLDFGKAYLDNPPDFSDEVLATLWAERAAAYEPHQWPLVRKVTERVAGAWNPLLRPTAGEYSLSAGKTSLRKASRHLPEGGEKIGKKCRGTANQCLHRVIDLCIHQVSERAITELGGFHHVQSA